MQVNHSTIGKRLATLLDYDFIDTSTNRYFARDKVAAQKMDRRVEEIGTQGDTIREIVEIWISGCCAGLGERVFDKLEAELAHGLFYGGGQSSAATG